MLEITAVPRLPQPMIPMRMAELARLPKTVDGFKTVSAEIAAVEATNFLRLIGFIIVSFIERLGQSKLRKKLLSS
jgi:hypothetical protein